MKRNNILILLLIAIFLSVVICDKEKDFKGDSDRKRSVECQSSSTSHEVKSKGKFKGAGVELENELKIKVEYNDNNLRAKLEFESQSKTNGTELKSKQNFRMVFWEVFSYVPTSTTSGYNGETKTSSYFLGSRGTSIQQFDSNNNKCKLNDANGVYTFRATATLNGTGSITISFNFAGSNFQSGTVNVPNNALKFTVNITDYPFPAGTDTQYVGMRMIMLSKEKVGQKTKAKVEGQENDAIVTESTSNSAWFAWVPTVTDENGSNVPVYTSSVSAANNFNGTMESGDSSNQVYFAFGKSRPKSLNWDPQIGVQTTSSSSLLGLSALLLVLLLFFF